MKDLNWIIVIAIGALVSGCSTYVVEVSPTPHRYPKGDLSLHLAQRADSALELELRNTSSRPITNAFPETLFMGTFTLVQVNQNPCEGYHKDYWDLLIHATIRNPDQRVIEAGGHIVYEVPLGDLVVPLPEVNPEARDDIMAFATMRGFDLSLNAIILKHRDRVSWGETGLDHFFHKAAGE